MNRFEIKTYHAGKLVTKLFWAGQEVKFLMHQGKIVYANQGIPLPPLVSRVVTEGAWKWFEFGFLSGEEIFGNPIAGWVDAGGYAELSVEYSIDLVTWSLVKFVPAPVPVINNGDGTWWYWVRAIHPQDAAAKTGALFANNENGDSRNNGFTSIVLGGVAIALPGFPYNMATPGKSAEMQAHLRAAGFAGALVTGTTAANWTVSIPAVNYVSFAATSFLGIPSYLVPDIFGALTNSVSTIGFKGTFVDSNGMAVYQKGFGRLGIKPGVRYNPIP